MEIKWKIDYKKKIATSELLEVEIDETKKSLAQEFRKHKVAIGFEKNDTNRKYFCKVTRIDGSLWEESDLLPNYGIELEKVFDEESWDAS